MHFAGAVVASWSLTPRDGRFEPFYCNDKFFLSMASLNSMKTFREKTQLIDKCKYFHKKHNQTDGGEGGDKDVVTESQPCNML